MKKLIRTLFNKAATEKELLSEANAIALKLRKEVL